MYLYKTTFSNIYIIQVWSLISIEFFMLEIQNIKKIEEQNLNVECRISSQLEIQISNVEFHISSKLEIQILNVECRIASQLHTTVLITFNLPEITWERPANIYWRETFK